MRILLSGYYGFGNLGDEALLEVITTALRKRYAGVEIEVLSATPEQTAAQLGVAATPRADWQNVKQAIERSDIVLSGGGGLLQNVTSLKSLIYYAGIIRTAIHARRKTMIFAQSIGPLDLLGRQTVRECCKGIHAATVRDERSRELLSDLLGDVPIERSADPVFLCEEPPRLPDPLAELGISPDRLVIVSVRKTKGMADGVQRIAKAVDALAELGAQSIFLPFGGIEDAEISTEIIRRCKSTPLLLPLDSLATAARWISNARLVIGVRLHALILAMRFGVPFLAVPYDPKVASLCEDAAYPLPPLWTPGARTEQATDAAALARSAWERHGELAAHLAIASQKMRALAEYNFEVLDRLAETQSG